MIQFHCDLSDILRSTPRSSKFSISFHDFGNINYVAPVAARSKPYVLAAWIVGLNPAGDKDVCLLCLYVMLSCVGKGLSRELITCPKESYPVSNKIYNPPPHKKNGIGKVNRRSNPKKNI
jgi:hypothetical protein